MSHDLKIPRELQQLIDNGVWPNAENVKSQNLNSFVSSKLIHKIAPELDHIFFSSPPFLSIARYAKNNKFFWSSDAAPNEIDFDLSLLIGDFGLGSDSPIILNYEHDAEEPTVKRLKWSMSREGVNHWVEIAPTFAQFAEVLELI